MNLAFCFGVPKSGTTFLQMILNAHPEVSCPSEHQFEYFHRTLPDLFGGYTQLLKDVDARTGGQGSSPFTDDDRVPVLQAVIRTAAKRGADGRDVVWYGVNDNAITSRCRQYMNWFPKARFICIVRDPRSVIVSSWHHNHRIDNGFQSMVDNLDDWARTAADIWVRDMNGVTELMADSNFSDRMTVCRYEDLVTSPETSYRELFEFIGVTSSIEVLAPIIDVTDFGNMRDDAFFRKASIDGWSDELSSNALGGIIGACGELMDRYQYEK
jgi:hypothetical protein